ncbi:hypothetical protein NA78x_001539 [Anatilimnocola sp. NA78]|uniref:DUF6985 domain-containing protein n=1 Tax=Anatilimnocola sp. NA78 TaxID=3415683 RepID=UPI003CE4C142
MNLARIKAIGAFFAAIAFGACAKVEEPQTTAIVTVNYDQFRFDKYFWIGKHDVSWLGPEVEFIINADATDIPQEQRQVVDFVGNLPPSTKAKLERFIYNEYRSKIYGGMTGNDYSSTPRVSRSAGIWKLLSQPGIQIPSDDRLNPDRYFTVSFEAVGDEEHGIAILFNDRGEPVKLGGQGAFFNSFFRVSFLSRNKKSPRTAASIPGGQGFGCCTGSDWTVSGFASMLAAPRATNSLTRRAVSIHANPLFRGPQAFEPKPEGQSCGRRKSVAIYVIWSPPTRAMCSLIQRFSFRQCK